MVGLFTGKIRQNRGMLFHGNILAHQPILVDPQIRGKEMRDIGTGTVLPLTYWLIWLLPSLILNFSAA